MGEALGLLVAGLVLGGVVPLAVGAGGRGQAAGVAVGAVAMLAIGLALPGRFWAYALATLTAAAAVTVAARLAGSARSRSS